MRAIEGRRPFVILGTGGSTDYLKDTTGDRRYWTVSTGLAEDPTRMDADTHAFLKSAIAKLLSIQDPLPSKCRDLREVQSMCSDKANMPIGTTKKES